MSCFPLSDWRAIQAGAQTIPTNIDVAAIYFIIKTVVDIDIILF